MYKQVICAWESQFLKQNEIKEMNWNVISVGFLNSRALRIDNCISSERLGWKAVFPICQLKRRTLNENNLLQWPLSEPLRIASCQADPVLAGSPIWAQTALSVLLNRDLSSAGWPVQCSISSHKWKAPQLFNVSYQTQVLILIEGISIGCMYL